MKLEITDPRQALIIRMQAHAYENVIGKDYQEAQRLASKMLEYYDRMVEEKPTDAHGYWSVHFFNVFKDSL